MGRGGVVLVVDDDVALRDALSELLEDEGYVTLAARTGREAIAVLERAEPLPCAILLDLRMPDMNGEEFLEVRRNDPRFSSICTALMTADTHASPRALQEADLFLRKPIAVEDLLGFLAECCPTRH
jgi:CheY-like chemotaxis protein